MKTTARAPLHREFDGLAGTRAVYFEYLPTHLNEAWALFLGRFRTLTQYSSRASGSISTVVE